MSSTQTKPPFPIIQGVESMPWEYSQSTGQLHRIQNGARTHIGTGYSGINAGLNNPGMENIANTGPIPRGMWTIGTPRRSPNTGPHVLDLSPNGHNAHGRTSFQIHGDNTTPQPNDASNGCIILPRNLRETISRSNDNVLYVVR
jgi:hypothetical protein